LFGYSGWRLWECSFGRSPGRAETILLKTRSEQAETHLRRARKNELTLRYRKTVMTMAVTRKVL
jgi:hypothetical protein